MIPPHDQLSKAHSYKYLPAWTHTPRVQLFADQGPILWNTTVWLWLGFTVKVTAELWKSSYTEDVHDEKRKNKKTEVKFLREF